jgi:hypothetical protein
MPYRLYLGSGIAGPIGPRELTIVQEQLPQEEQAFLDVLIQAQPSAPYSTIEVPKPRRAKAKARTGITVTPEMMQAREAERLALLRTRITTECSIRQVERTRVQERAAIYATPGRKRTDMAVAQAQGAQDADAWQQFRFEPRIELPTIEEWIGAKK